MPWTPPSGITYLFPWENDEAGGTSLSAANLLEMQQDWQNFVLAATTSLAAYVDTSVAAVQTQVTTLQATVAALSGGGTTTPTNLGAPVLSGSLTVGDVLSCTPGTWSETTTGIAYQAQRSTTEAGTFTNVSTNGGTTDAYTLQAADEGDYFRYEVTATFASGGPVTAYSNVIGPIAAAPVTLTLSNMEATVSGSTVTVTVHCSSDIENVTCDTGSGYGTQAAADETPVNGVATFTIPDVTETTTYYCVGYNVASGQSGGSATPTVSATATITSSSSQVINAAPTGPATPSGGWTAVFADGFNSANTLWSKWGPGTSTDFESSAGSAGNGATVMNSSQVAIASDGLEITAERLSSPVSLDGTSYNYRSGKIDTFASDAPDGEGFEVMIGGSGQWAFEIVATMPVNTDPSAPSGGGDWSFWMFDPGYTRLEVDFFEYLGYGPTPSTTTYYITNLMCFIQPTPYATEEVVYGDLSQSTDQEQHRWTFLFNDTARTCEAYIDGTAVGGYAYPQDADETSMPYPTSLASVLNGEVPTSLHIDFDMRNGGTAPTWTGSRKYVIRSVAVYRDTDHVGDNYTNGGIAPGTTVA